MTQSDEPLSLKMDLTCRGDRNEIMAFQISMHADAVAQLINDALRGERVYELFSIRRHGDLKRYLWVRIIEVDERVKSRYQYASEETIFGVTRRNPDWPENELPYPKWDNALFLTGDEQPEECA
ncbi:MAG: hypothetical protein ABJA60_02675 [Nitrosospira sp.]